MRRALRLLVWAALVFACSGKEKPAVTAPAIGIARMAPADDAAAIAPLVPTDAAYLLRISSVEKLQEIVERLRAELPVPLPPDVLALVTASVQLDPAAVQHGRPIFLCANLGQRDARPKLTLIAPVDDPDAIAAAHRGGGSAVAGGYVALSQLAGGYAVGGSRLVPGILDGDISSRCDLTRLVSTYRTDIEDALHAFDEGFAMGVRQGLPALDPTEMTARISDWLRKLVDSAETLDAVLHHADGRFDVQLALTASEGSPLARPAAHGRSELLELGRYLPPGMPVTMLLRLDLAGMNELFLPLLMAPMEKRPAEEREAMEVQVRRANEAARLLTDDWAMALDFGKDGMRAAMVGGARDAKAYLAAYRDLLRTPSLAQIGMEFREQGTREVAGTTVERMRMTFDVQKYCEFLGMEPFDTRALGTLNAALALMFGEDGMAFELAARKNRIFIVTGSGGGLMDRMLTADEAPAWLEGTAAAIGGDLGFLVRLEMRGCTRGISEMMQKLVPGMPARVYPSGKELPVVLYGCVDGRVYRGGMTCDLGEIAAFFRSGRARTK
jgi:hypothetical protein